MLRAIGVLGLALLAFAGAGPHRAQAGSRRAPDQPPSVVTIGGPATGQAIPPGFLGLSFEYWAVRDYAGGNPRHVNPVFLQLIRNLTGGSQPDLRIGGDSTDNTWWPMPGVSAPPGVVFGLTRRWIATIGAVAVKLDARLILGINLEADSPAVAAAEAKALVAGVGRPRVEGLELGNEPELYGAFLWGFSGRPGRPSNWNFAAFDRDFAHIASALAGLPLAGPTVGQPNWFGYTRRFLSTQPMVAVVALHRYPLQQCFLRPNQFKYPSLAHLFAAAASRGLANSVAGAVSAAHADHIPLWSLDALFEMARVGVDGVNIHTFPGAAYQLFTFRPVDGRWRAVVKPDYYGLAMFAQAAPAGSRLLEVSPTGSQQLKIWATRAPDGTVRVTLINEGTRPRSLAIRVPATAPGPGTLERLEAPGITATGRVTLAGQTFGAATGLPVGTPHTTPVPATANGYVISVPAASAAMLTLG